VLLATNIEICKKRERESKGAGIAVRIATRLRSGRPVFDSRPRLGSFLFATACG